MALTDLTFSKQGEAYVSDPVKLMYRTLCNFNRMQAFILNLQVKIRKEITSLCFRV